MKFFTKDGMKGFDAVKGYKEEISILFLHDLYYRGGVQNS